MALSLPVLSRTRRKDNPEAWVRKQSVTSTSGGQPPGDLSKPSSQRPGVKARRESTGPSVSRLSKSDKEKEGEEKGQEQGKKERAEKERLVAKEEEEEREANSRSDTELVLEVTSDDPEVMSPSMKTYRRAAKRLAVTPLRKVLSELGKERMSFRNLTLTTRDMKALCTALLRERDVLEMDFSGNYIGGRECDYLVCVLSRADMIETLDVSNNCLSGRAIRSLSSYICDSDNLVFLDISGNKLLDADAGAVASFLTTNNSLRTLVMNHNEFRETGGKLIGNAIGKNRSLEELELRWNHLRRDGAIGIARGLEENRSLKRVDLAWNGFGYEGCVALSDALGKNYVLEDLDVSSNRINPPALLELVKGLAKNKALKALRIGQNPITAPFTSVLLNTIHKNPTVVIEHLDMEGIVVDQDFQAILDAIRTTRSLYVNYDLILPVKAMSREQKLSRIQEPGAYNLDPLHMFYLLKQKMRASDFFHKINKDNDNGLSREELSMLFEQAGIPVTGSVIDAIVNFLDADGDGTIDLGEFVSGDKKMKKISRQAKEKKKKRSSKDLGNYNKYSRTFKKAELDPINLSVNVEQNKERLAYLANNPDTADPVGEEAKS